MPSEYLIRVEDEKNIPPGLLNRDDTPRFPVETVTFTAYPAGTGEFQNRCGRCGKDLAVHLWQFIDPDMTDQRGVFDCGIAE